MSRGLVFVIVMSRLGGGGVKVDGRVSKSGGRVRWMAAPPTGITPSPPKILTSVAINRRQCPIRTSIQAETSEESSSIAEVIGRRNEPNAVGSLLRFDALLN